MDDVRPIEILVVDDSPGDVRLMVEALKDGRLRNHLSVLNDGIDVMAYLKRQGQYADAVRPDLILLDLNMPRKGGREVLAEIKADRDLHTIPVVVLTTSKADEDVIASYELQANCYVTKPVDLDRFMTAIRSVSDFWVQVVQLPPREH